MRRAATAAWRAAALPSARPISSVARPAPAPAAVRNFSSSSPSNFFFRKPTKSTGELARELLDTKKQDRPDLLAKLYPAYVDSLKLSSSASASSSSRRTRPPLDHAELHSLLRFAATTNRFALALRIFNDLPTVHSLSQTPGDHHLLVLAMSRTGRLAQAQQYLLDLERTYGFKPHISDWNVLLGGYRSKGDLDSMARVVELMRSPEFGTEPNVVSYNTFLSALFEQGKLAEVRALVGEMRSRQDVASNVWTETALLTGFLDAGELASAREVRDRLAGMVEDGLNKGKDEARDDTAALNALIKFEAADRGFRAGVKLAGKYAEMGVELNLRTVTTLAQEGAKTVASAEEGVRLVEGLEELLPDGRRAERHAWSAVIVALTRRAAGADEALKLYHLARDRGVQPDSQMVQPLLDTVLSSPPSPDPDEDPLFLAKSLYEDLSTSSRSYSIAPDAHIYSTLLLACASPPSSSPLTPPDLDWSRTLIADMKSRSLKLDGPTTVRVILALQRGTKSWEEAFSVYDTLRALDPSVLDLVAYNTLLHGFVHLVPPLQADIPAPSPLVNEFLSDMRRTSYPPDSTTYALLLTYYSRAAPAGPAARQTITHLHSLLKLDVHLDPDTALFNALMAAYSHTRAYGKAFGVWDSMVANQRSGVAGVDETSLSVFLDTCGWEGGVQGEQRGRHVWEELEKGWFPAKGLRRNKKNWDSWVEALCRWGRFEEAEEAVFGRMVGEEVKEGAAPRATTETVETLLRFARRQGKEAHERVARRLREERPDLWAHPSVRRVAEEERWEEQTEERKDE
ncbi:hypothetical protein JCM11251_000724 [Rhodosporidiobolus azoricus]